MRNTLITLDGIDLFYKDWGSGEPIVFLHGWPLNTASWEAQMLFFVLQGYRCIAYDRRGHGRSGQSSDGYEMNAYADDLATVMETLNLEKAVLVGFSTGCGEVVRYIGRHGSQRVAGVVLVSAVLPLMLKNALSSGGVPSEVFNGIQAGEIVNRAQFYRDIATGPFFGFNRLGAKPSHSLIDAFVAAGMQASPMAVFECIKVFSKTDFTDDLKRFDVPTLMVYGDDDQIVPIDALCIESAKLVKDAQLLVYPGGPHGLTYTHKDQLNADLLAFIRGIGS